MAAPVPNPIYEIKKYPNRRFYDVTRSRHVGLADLHNLVRAGHQIVVRDSKSGADITNVVLTQIILEHDPPKLELFPASLLHQAIQSNQQMVRGFIEQYFSRAMDAYLGSKRQFDEFLSRSGLSPLSPMAPLDWVRMLVPGAASSSGAPSASPPASADSIDALKAQVEALSDQLRELREGAGSARTARSRARRKPRTNASKRKPR